MRWTSAHADGHISRRRARIVLGVGALAGGSVLAAQVRHTRAARHRDVPDGTILDDEATQAPPDVAVPAERPLEFASVPAHFAATAQRHPNRVALRTATAAATYGDLLTAASAQATPPHGRGTRRAALLSATLTPETVSTILGLFASGVTVVALDPDAPAGRVAAIAAILTAYGYALSRNRPAELTGVNESATGAIDLGDVASIQFTSGSTGTPKAVPHTHGLWLADAHLLNDRFGFTDGATVALCMPVSFAGGLNVLIGSLVGGAEIIAVDPREHSAEQALRRIRESRARIIACTPSFVAALHGAAAGATLPAVERIVTTGEATQARHIRLARELAPAATFTNWAGSTETLAIASHDIRPDAPLPRGVIPVGIPAPHKRIAVAEDGTVSVTSRHLGPGYLDRAETAARFVDNGDGTTTYVGGDLGRWDAHGRLVLSGRADSTVKIRGYLVEPAEIESTLAAYPDVREVAVLAEAGHPPRLTAYVAPDSASRTPSAAELRMRLHRDLPPWMVPTYIVILGVLPRGDRGKVDRTALPRPTRPDYEPPRRGAEAAVAEVWADVLRVDSVGRADSFYALGGDSLSATQMLVALERSHGVPLAPADLAEAPTVSMFAARLAGGARPAANGLRATTVALRPVSPDTVGTPLLCFAGAGASSLCFLPLAEHVGPRTAVYAFEPSGLDPRTYPDWSIDRAVRRHWDDLRRVQPHGPYTLIGHSLGAHIAVETARRLEAEGETVDRVVLLDPWLSPRVARRERLPDASVTLQTDDANGFGTWWDRQKQVPLAGLFVADPARRTLAVEEVNMVAGYRHRPRPWAGRALLVRSHRNRDDPRLWRRVLTGDVETRVLECDHHSMVRAPHIGVVAELLTGPGATAPR